MNHSGENVYGVVLLVGRGCAYFKPAVEAQTGVWSERVNVGQRVGDAFCCVDGGITGNVSGRNRVYFLCQASFTGMGLQVFRKKQRALGPRCPSSSIKKEKQSSTFI